MKGSRLYPVSDADHATRAKDLFRLGIKTVRETNCAASDSGWTDLRQGPLAVPPLSRTKTRIHHQGIG